MGTLDLEAETARRDLRVVHVGFARGELRLVFATAESRAPSLVVELGGIHSYFERGVVSCGAVLAYISEPGSFGWHFSPEERARHKEIRFNPKSDPATNVFRALARTITVRDGEPEDINFPG